MSFKIGQILSSSYTDSDSSFYDDEQKNTDKPVESFITKISSIQFTDKIIPYNFQTDQNYYMKIKIQRKNTQQNITLKLTNGDDTSTATQEIDSFIIYPGISASNAVDSSSAIGIYQDQNIDNSYAVIETVFSPNSAYSNLAIILDRELADFGINRNTSSEQENETIQDSLTNLDVRNLGRIVQIQSYQIYRFKNLLNNIQTQKIGIQGPTGMLMCINGEGIRIGPSGIYEIKNGYKVKFLGIVRHNSQSLTGSFGRDNFIVDYQYNSNQTSDINNEEGE